VLSARPLCSAGFGCCGRPKKRGKELSVRFPSEHELGAGGHYMIGHDSDDKGQRAAGDAADFGWNTWLVIVQFNLGHVGMGSARASPPPIVENIRFNAGVAGAGQRAASYRRRKVDFLSLASARWSKGEVHRSVECRRTLTTAAQLTGPEVA
jgi:hypothetical protein